MSRQPLSASPTIVFRKRRLGPLALLVLCSVTLAVGTGSGLFFLTASDVEAPLRWLSIGLAVFLVGFSLSFLRLAIARLRGPDDALIVGPAGLHDRLLSQRPILWPEIVRARLEAGHRASGPFLFIDVGPDTERRAGVRLGRRLAARANRAFGQPGYIVRTIGTEATSERLARAVARFRAVEGLTSPPAATAAAQGSDRSKTS